MNLKYPLILSLLALAGCGSSSGEPEAQPNRAPVFQSDAVSSAQVATLYSYLVLASDPDGDPVTLSVIGLPDWLSFEPVSGLLSGQPASQDAGEVQLTLKASDGQAEVLQTLTLTILPQAVEPPPESIESLSQKRGIAFGHHSQQDLAAAAGKMKWWYNWSTGAESEVAESYSDYGFDFVPMAWNGNFNEAELRSFLDAHPDVQYLLGFNEPNFQEQANLTPAEAAALWPTLEAIADDYDLKLVVPAVNYSPGNVDIPGTDDDWDPWQYLDAFFAACEGCRVDYIAVHSYMKYAGAFTWFVGEFERYGKPIWVTEWASWDEGGPANMGQQMDYLAETVRWLEANEMVYRYAWFIGRSSEGFDHFPYLDIYGEEGEFTPLGSIYTSIPSISYRYQAPVYIEAEGAHRLSGFSHLQACDSSGLAQLQSSTGGVLEYDFELTDAGAYSIQLRLAAANPSSLVIKLDDQEIYRLSDFTTGGANSWQTFTSPEISFKAGEQTLSIEATGRLGLNWLILGDAEPAEGTSLEPICTGN